MAESVEAKVTTKISPVSVTETVTRLTGLLSQKGLKVFAVIDQSAEASQVGLQLRETVLVARQRPLACLSAPAKSWRPGN
jgi:uncharacterized protein (DUF302 family)